MAPRVEGEERVMKPRSAAHEKQGWMILSREGSWKAFSVRFPPLHAEVLEVLVESE